MPAYVTVLTDIPAYVPVCTCTRARAHTRPVTLPKLLGRVFPRVPEITLNIEVPLFLVYVEFLH